MVTAGSVNIRGKEIEVVNLFLVISSSVKGTEDFFAQQYKGSNQIRNRSRLPKG